MSSCNILWVIGNHKYGDHLENYETKVGTLFPKIPSKLEVAPHALKMLTG